jgi:hypothetical protein
MSADIKLPFGAFLFQSFMDYRATVGNQLSNKMWVECADQAHTAWHDYRKKQKTARAKRVKKFVPPTPAEVEAYSTEIGWPLNGEDWVLHYEKKEWKYGKDRPVVNWKLAVQTWKRAKWKSPNPPAMKLPTAVNGCSEPEGWREKVRLQWKPDDDSTAWTQSALACTWENMPRHWKPKIVEICQSTSVTNQPKT